MQKYTVNKTETKTYRRHFYSWSCWACENWYRLWNICWTCYDICSRTEINVATRTIL